MSNIRLIGIGSKTKIILKLKAKRAGVTQKELADFAIMSMKITDLIWENENTKKKKR